MSGFRRRRGSWSVYPEYRPKEPPPESGIKVGKKLGSTWWGRRWIEALEAFSSDFTSRLGRGKTYARAGRVHDLAVSPGAVTACVTGSRPSPYKVKIRIDELSSGAWSKAIAAMAQSAAFSARLLAGEMPEGVDEAFRGTGEALFPSASGDLASECSCPDWANPCKHVSALLYVLGEAFDRDPFLLFELRGRAKQSVLDALRSARSSSSETPRVPKRAPRRTAPPRTASVKLSDAAAYEKSASSPAALAEMRFRFDAPAAASGAVLRQLGPPPGWSKAPSLAERIAPALAKAAELARRLALANSGEAGEREPGGA